VAISFQHLLIDFYSINIVGKSVTYVECNYLSRLIDLLNDQQFAASLEVATTAFNKLGEYAHSTYLTLDYLELD